MSDTVIFYGTPAHGHINPTLPIITRLVDKNYKVIYYATEEYRDVITDAGADFRAYDFGGIEWNPEVGSRIFKLTELVLKFTDKQLKSMSAAAEFSFNGNGSRAYIKYCYFEILKIKKPAVALDLVKMQLPVWV